MLWTTGLQAAALAAVALTLHTARADELTIDPESYMKHVRYLASDTLAGRLPGSRGGELAGKYLAAQFRALGLRPAGDENTYFQTFEVKRLKRFDRTKAAMQTVGGLERAGFEVGKDWVPLPFSPITDGVIRGPLMFAGYGIHAPELGRDDYAGMDVSDKIVVVLRGEPKTADGKSALDPTEESTRHALFSRKAEVAAARGAKALLIINQRAEPTDDPKELIKTVAADAHDELFPTTEWNTGPTYGLPMAHVTRRAVEKLLAVRSVPVSEPTTLGHLELALQRDMYPITAAFDPQVDVAISLGLSYVRGRNVLGVLRGSEAPDEYILVGGHYDHLGKVPNPRFGDGKPVIHNGADDNASGTAGVLELARAFAKSRERPRRSILFAAWDAEELGLLGSAHFVDTPTVPLPSIKTVINLDMIGRLNLDRFTIYGVGSAREFYDLLTARAQQLDLEFKSPRSGRRTFGGSDHMTFHQRGIPVLFPFTGVHAEYNTPNDDWDTIDHAGAAKVLKLMAGVVHKLAEMESGPEFVAPENESLPGAEVVEHAAQQPGARGAVEPTGRGHGRPTGGDDTRPSRGRLKVALGVMPDMAAEPGDGMPIQAVMADGAAQAAGIQDGDVIRKIGDTAVTDIYSYMSALMAFKPGDEVDIVVTRDGERLKLRVKLKESTRSYQPQDQ